MKQMSKQEGSKTAMKRDPKKRQLFLMHFGMQISSFPDVFQSHHFMKGKNNP